MKVIDNDIICCFDVDDTLIVCDNGDITVTQGVYTAQVSAIHDNIEALKRHKTYGQTIVVWSRSGYKWAEAVVNALNIERYVDYCLTKPTFYYDDIPVEKWMGSPRWGGDKR